MTRTRHLLVAVVMAWWSVACSASDRAVLEVNATTCEALPQADAIIVTITSTLTGAQDVRTYPLAAALAAPFAFTATVPASLAGPLSIDVVAGVLCAAGATCPDGTACQNALCGGGTLIIRTSATAQAGKVAVVSACTGAFDGGATADMATDGDGSMPDAQVADMTDMADTPLVVCDPLSSTSCGPDESCQAAVDNYYCASFGTLDELAPCDSQLANGDCGRDLVCINDGRDAVCLAYCDNTAALDTCSDTTYCGGAFDGLPGNVGLCLPNCDIFNPIAADCNQGGTTGRACLPVPENARRIVKSTCIDASNAAIGDACTMNTTGGPQLSPCRPGLICVQDMGPAPTCRPLCDPTPSSPHPCDPVNGTCRKLTAFTHLGFCGLN